MKSHKVSACFGEGFLKYSHEFGNCPPPAIGSSCLAMKSGGLFNRVWKIWCLSETQK